MWTKIRQYLQHLLGRGYQQRIRTSDTGFFDPYLPISSLKPLSEGYEFEAAAAEAALNQTTPYEKREFYFFKALLVILGAALAFRLVFLQVSHGQDNFVLAEGNRLRTELITPPRGLFYDRNGTPLVANSPSFAVVLQPIDLPTQPAARQNYINILAGILNQPVAELGQKVKDNYYKQTLVLADGLNRDQAINLELKLNNLAGVYLITTPIRQYNTGVADLGHILGYIGKVTAADLKSNPDLLPTALIGKTGLEKQYDQALAGVPGVNTYEVDSTGRTIRSVGSKPAEPGQSLILSLDSGLQNVTAQALGQAISKSGGTSGAAVAMDPNTGQILAMVSFPNFDPNIFNPGVDQQTLQNVLNDPLSPLLNRVVAGQYPSGSTIKPVIGVAALEEKVVTPSTLIDTTGGQITVGQSVFHDWTNHVGNYNLLSAIANSNDIYFYKIGGGYGNFTGLGVSRLTKWLSQFGFGQPTGIDLPNEAGGLVPTPDWMKRVKNENWYVGNTYNISIGQGDLLVTPLQLDRAVAAIANGGKLLEPVLVKSILDVNGQSQDIVPKIVNSQVASAANLQAVRDGMRQTVTNGSASQYFKSFSIPVAAKTGTAQISSTSLTHTHSWFTAFAPYDSPQITLAVVVEGGGEGWEVAGPVARNMLEQFFHLPLSPVNPPKAQ